MTDRKPSAPQPAPDNLADIDPQETAEWLESLDSAIEIDGPRRASFLLEVLLERARARNVPVSPELLLPYVNTIAADREPAYPGNRAVERRLRAILRWNAMAMVHRANTRDAGQGGHISTYASAATLYEVALNHFVRGPEAPGGGDQVYFQAHASPGMYARAFLQDRLGADDLDRFRLETRGKRGLCSYPHPWLMRDFWQFPTASMGLSSLAAIYQARFNRYLLHRGLKDTSDQRVWCFVGDGETDEPESRGGLALASREGLDNLVFVISCNLQRLDGPVRGNSSIVAELEAVFRGAGWNVIKVLWGPEWDELLAGDHDGRLTRRLGQLVDGQWQKFSVEGGAYIRQHLFASDPDLLARVAHLSDEDLAAMRRGGHSSQKIFAAYDAAMAHRGQPSVILAHTVKGWALGRHAGSNVTHQLKKLTAEQLGQFRDALGLSSRDIPDENLAEAPYVHPGPESDEIRYLRQRRRALGGPLPDRRQPAVDVSAPGPESFAEFLAGSESPASTTMAFARMLRSLMRDASIGKRVVPIIPDEARTFGMDPLFRQVGIYSPVGQLYDPVDSKMLLHYRESKDGQLLEEGITEAGSMASFTAAGTAYSTHGLMMIPFYIFYSIFGLQRTADQVWAFGDNRGRGFMMGATAGRTTLNGEGLQHQDGASHLFAHAFPTLWAYDPAYAYELAVIVRAGLEQMIERDEDALYYITLYNETYPMPAMPTGDARGDDAAEGIVRGMYLVRPAIEGKSSRARVQLFGSGTILPCALEAQALLAERFDVAADVWSVTSYQQLFRDGRRVSRQNRLQPENDPERPYIARVLDGPAAASKRPHPGPIVAASDWVAEVPGLVAPLTGRRFIALGTDGFGRSDTRAALRDHFEVDARWMAYSALYALMRDGEDGPGEPGARDERDQRIGQIDRATVARAARELDIDPGKADPFSA